MRSKPHHKQHRRPNGSIRLLRFAPLLTVGLFVGALGMPAEAIVGGSTVSPNDYPFFVQVNEAGFLCGGSIIDADVVLTAAHCVENSVGNPANVTVMVHDTNPVVGAAITVHPLWNGDLGDGHDIAVVYLAPGSTAGITPVVVGSPLDDDPYTPGHEATTIGHGYTGKNGAPTSDLRDVQIPIRSDSYMSDLYDPWWWTDEWSDGLHIGAGSTNQTTCYGDSGGPLMVQQAGRIVEIGVTSFGFPQLWSFDECTVPSAFSEMSGHQLAWVATQVPGVQPRWLPCVGYAGQTGHVVASYISYPSVNTESSSFGCATPIPAPDPKPKPRPPWCRAPQNICREP
jgi:Trypsin